MNEVMEDLLSPFDTVLARAWRLRPGDICPECPMRSVCPDKRRCLHLVASVGLTGRLEGPFRRIPIGVGPVGETVERRAPQVLVEDLGGAGLADPAWIALHGVRAFATASIERESRVLGALAIFSRRELRPGDGRSLAACARLLALGMTPSAQEPARTLAEIEREAIERALAASRGRVSGPTGAARVLGLKPTTLHSRMKKLGVRRPKPRLAR